MSIRWALGRRPPKRAPAVMLKLTGVVPEHPATVDHLSRAGLAFGLYENDDFSDCGPTSVANLVRLVTSWLGGGMVAPTQNDVFDLYRRSGNPDFNPATDADDNGVDMQTMLEALLAEGIGGRKPVAFASVDHTDVDAVRAAVAIFGGVLFGVDLQEAQRDQTDARRWEYAPSPEWGGHAVMAGQYEDPDGVGSDVLGVVTWAQQVECTDAFLAHQLDEVWVVIWPEHLTDAGFLAGVDVQALAADYQALTGRPLPIPLPGPDPRPDPGAASFPVAADLVARIDRVAARHRLSPQTWLDRHLRNYFDLMTTMTD